MKLVWHQGWKQGNSLGNEIQQSPLGSCRHCFRQPAGSEDKDTYWNLYLLVSRAVFVSLCVFVFARDIDWYCPSLRRHGSLITGRIKCTVFHMTDLVSVCFRRHLLMSLLLVLYYFIILYLWSLFLASSLISPSILIHVPSIPFMAFPFPQRIMTRHSPGFK